MATNEANFQGCNVAIVLATIEAETNGRNIPGDSGNALGYGQVWHKWHMYAFNYAGKRLGIVVPTSLSALTTLTIGNDMFSMIVAVNVIKGIWGRSNGSWANFTYSYVGPAIPKHDFDRRKNIWSKYQGSNHDYSNSAEDYVDNSGSAGFIGPQADIVFPITNYKALDGSEKHGDLLYGRKYRIIVSSLDGTKALDVSELRCVFECIKVIQMQPQFSTITIYNLSAKTENTIIAEGSRVVLEAGYEGSQYGVIFDGNVVQSIRGKEDAVTYILTLVAADSDMWMNYSLSAFSMVKGQNCRAALENMASKATIPSDLGSISNSLSKSKLTRGKVFFGLTSDYVRQIARSENATAFVSDGKINLIKAGDIPDGEIIDLSPETGLLDVPAQNEYGVTIKCLLNPRIKVGSLLHIDKSIIRNQQYAQGQPIYSLDQDGIYRVIKITNVGDTRGNDWYTEVETVTQSGILPAMVANGTQSPW